MANLGEKRVSTSAKRRKERIIDERRSRGRVVSEDGAKPKDGRIKRVQNERRNEGYLDASGVRLLKHPEKINYKDHLESKVSSER